MCENLDVDLEAIACVHSLQYSTLQYCRYENHAAGSKPVLKLFSLVSW